MIGAESESREWVGEAREAVHGVERGEEETEDGGPMSSNVRGRARSELERDGERAERRRLSKPFSFSFSRPRPRARLGRGVCSGSTTMLGIGEEDAGEGVLLPLYAYRGSTSPISSSIPSPCTLSSSTSYLQLSTTGRSANVTPPARRERLPVPVPLCDGARVRIERGAVAREATEDAAEDTEEGR
jgi:hypothetical protein